ncbi:VOC family protein [Rhodohalobacter sulfatireducens]|uniref:VOC family protein n=1 Tax=Rhodohalobacter sulfatireducens TaxID=2911366 RepID=A0ABS9KGD9_9BACT|nr:VOC family protein [Rhodohalobacter sulfatireducens]MCG2589867.1 VOC family protein [Rhodohalobacter sulfatireducens]
MHIEHLAIWTKDLERLREFYETYFDATSNSLYVNEKKQFRSYFLTFDDSGARLELMQRPDIESPQNYDGTELFGYAHLAISVGSEDAVERLTVRLKNDGYPVLDGPRRTGDGYYESVVADPDGNRIEITI